MTTSILFKNTNQKVGLGLYLQGVAQSLQDKLRVDLHQPTRTLVSLDPYDHLQRLVRLCYTHAKRNIQKCNVNDDVRNLMRSLLCVKHDNWDGTLELIRQRGGKAGNGKKHTFMSATVTLMMLSLSDWIQDKLSSKFAFPALCWEKSLIPIEIWNAGDSTSNIIESVHADVNREGVGCTLVGAVKRGQAFDAMKMNDLKVLFLHYSPQLQ
jgi:hypothetical protein